jgi:predicted GH43/DUF377 family glycosyl hydrolase
MKDDNYWLMKRRLLFEKKGSWVFNPAVVKKGNKIHIFYREADKLNYSTIGHCVLENNKLKFYTKPALKPEYPYEVHGTEDPRITKIGKTYYMVYVAYDGHNARIAIATSKDLINWRKKGLNGPNMKIQNAIDITDSKFYKKNWIPKLDLRRKRKYLYDKDAVIFSEKINGKYAMLHRLEPHIQIVYFDKLSKLKNRNFWRTHIKNIDKYIIMKPKFSWGNVRIGAGTILKTPKGWMLFYHGIRGVPGKFKYTAGLAMLDLKDPSKVIARMKEPLFKAKFKWEKQGIVPNVVFPTGVVLDKNKVLIFYGCSDTRIGVAETTLDNLYKKLGL